MIKRIIALLLCILMLCAFAACKEDTKEETAQEQSFDEYNFMNYSGRASIENVQRITLPEALGTECESYKFTYLSDDVRVVGYISIPLECIETKTPYNCLIYNRGGNYRIGWLSDEDTARICAATGRIVVASQYRGADGSEGKDEFGGRDLQDVISLVDLCEKEFGFADITNLCMVGISRGGMMSYLAAHKDTRVKGIVAVSAVTDLVDAYNGREDIRDLLEETIGGSPEELPEEYAKRSPINFAEELDLPVYIIHDRGDTAVPVAQAEAMNEKLKGTKHGCSMTINNDSLHGLHEEDIVLIVSWLDQALPKN